MNIIIIVLANLPRHKYSEDDINKYRVEEDIIERNFIGHTLELKSFNNINNCIKYILTYKPIIDKLLLQIKYGYIKTHELDTEDNFHEINFEYLNKVVHNIIQIDEKIPVMINVIIDDKNYSILNLLDCENFCTKYTSIEETFNDLELGIKEVSSKYKDVSSDEKDVSSDEKIKLIEHVLKNYYITDDWNYHMEIIDDIVEGNTNKVQEVIKYNAEYNAEN